MVIIHSLLDYIAALNQGETVIRTAPDMAAYSGVLFLKKMSEQAPDTPHRLIIDCGSDAGLALSVLREGFRHIAFDANSPAYAHIADIAGQYQASIENA